MKYTDEELMGLPAATLITANRGELGFKIRIGLGHSLATVWLTPDAMRELRDELDEALR